MTKEPDMYWYYVSLSDGKFVTGCFVQATGPIEAQKKANELRGSVSLSTLILLVEDEQIEEKVPVELRNVKLSKEQIEEAFGLKRITVGVKQVEE